MDCCHSCEKLIESFLPPEGHEHWRSLINNVHAELVLSKNQRGYRYDKKNEKKVLIYKLAMVEADVYNYIHDKNGYYWNKNIFQEHISRDIISYDGNFVYYSDYKIMPMYSQYDYHIYNTNSKASTNLTNWRDVRMRHLGVSRPWKNRYNY